MLCSCRHVPAASVTAASLREMMVSAYSHSLGSTVAAVRSRPKSVRNCVFGVGVGLQQGRGLGSN